MIKMKKIIKEGLEAINFDPHKLSKSIEEAIFLECNEQTEKEFRKGFYELVEFEIVNPNNLKLKIKNSGKHDLR